MTRLERAIIAAWARAAAELGLRVTSPATLEGLHCAPCTVPVLVHDYGRPAGTVVLVLGEPSELLGGLLARAAQNYRTALLAPHFRSYDRERFVATLADWGYYGSPAERPAWLPPPGARARRP
jgi:hypothetical protein